MYNPSLFSITILREMRWIKSQNHKSTVMITMQISIKCSNQICRQKLELKNCISFENRKKILHGLLSRAFSLLNFIQQNLQSCLAPWSIFSNSFINYLRYHLSDTHSIVFTTSFTTSVGSFQL